MSPSSYAPVAQTPLVTGSATLATFGISSTVAAGSSGGTISAIATWATPSAGTLAVASTAGFPASGTLLVQASGTTVATVTYTGTTSTTFTGCAYVSGSAAGTVSTGNLAALAGAASLISTGSFLAPPSGSVLVKAYCNIQVSANNSKLMLGLAAHNTVSPVVGNTVTWTEPTAGVPRQAGVPFLVTGLTAGTSYNYDLLGASSGGTMATILAQGASSVNIGNGGSPVIMTVQAA